MGRGIKQTGKIGFVLLGSSTPSGGSTQIDGFTARLIWVGDNHGTATIVDYVYSADRTNNLPYGDVHIIDDFENQTGTWMDITLVVTVNSVLEKLGGSLAIWIDDEVRL